MKKQLVIISAIVIIVSIFVSCSANSSVEDISTTAVTDSEGQAHYYELVTDENGKAVTDEEGNAVIAEIETLSDGIPVTEKDGSYVTKSTSSSSVAASQNKNSTSSSTTLSDSNNAADNEIEFETSASDTTKADITSDKKATTESNKAAQPATDNDGWITKWY